MRLEVDSFNDLVSDEHNIWHPEFRQRDWGFYYIDDTEENIKLMKIFNTEDNTGNNSTYYL